MRRVLVSLTAIAQGHQGQGAGSRSKGPGPGREGVDIAPGIVEKGIEGPVALVLGQRIEVAPPGLPLGIGHEAHQVEAEEGIAFDPEQGARGGIRVDDGGAGDVDGEKGVGDPVDGPRHRSPGSP